MQNYPETVFSSWMLEQPFVGLYERGLLTATGGTIILNGDLRTCNIGNFLTASTARGRGLAKIVAKHLIVLLQEEGIKIFTLGTTEENIPAWRAYEAIGFRIQETRPQFDLYPKGGAI
jgi:ribosomal protein S18 acetylase RimI-like enzyme